MEPFLPLTIKLLEDKINSIKLEMNKKHISPEDYYCLSVDLSNYEIDLKRINNYNEFILKN